MGAGKYDRRIKVECDERTEDDFGQKVENWKCAGHVWAEIIYGSPGERRVGAAQEQSNLPVTVNVRKTSFTSKIKADTYRLVFDNLTWDIEGPAPGFGSGRNKEIMITARARI